MLLPPPLPPPYWPPRSQHLFGDTGAGNPRGGRSSLDRPLPVASPGSWPCAEGRVGGREGGWGLVQPVHMVCVLTQGSSTVVCVCNKNYCYYSSMLCDVLWRPCLDMVQTTSSSMLCCVVFYGNRGKKKQSQDIKPQSTQSENRRGVCTKNNHHHHGRLRLQENQHMNFVPTSPVSYLTFCVPVWYRLYDIRRGSYLSSSQYFLRL